MKKKFKYAMPTIKLTLIIGIILFVNFILSRKYANLVLLNEYAQNILKISNANYLLSVLLFISISILTNMQFKTFFCALFFGIIPGSLVYSYAGSHLTNVNLITATLSFKILLLLGLIKIIGFMVLFVRFKFSRI